MLNWKRRLFWNTGRCSENWPSHKLWKLLKNTTFMREILEGKIDEIRKLYSKSKEFSFIYNYVVSLSSFFIFYIRLFLLVVVSRPKVFQHRVYVDLNKTPTSAGTSGLSSSGGNRGTKRRRSEVDAHLLHFVDRPLISKSNFWSLFVCYLLR
jgi:hypothetical protein